MSLHRAAGNRLGGFGLMLTAVLIIEFAVFSRTGANFVTSRNLFEILRLSTESGILAASMTAVILTGGIDLSVGSALGLCAVVFGKIWRDAGWPPGLAAVCALFTGAAGGGLNAWLITRLKMPPLIVTLGTFSLFRGVAEGVTRGTDNFTGFPPRFLFLGQGYVFDVVPAQVLVLVGISLAIWLLVHRTRIGREWRAIGFAPEGARFAALRVEQRLALAYVLSGTCAAVAGLIYVARVGQAKADAGTGYELSAITAVVLGGASIFGGKGSVHSTLLGVLVLVILKIGLTLSDQPAELTGLMTGGLLLLVLWGESLAGKISARRRRIDSQA